MKRREKTWLTPVQFDTIHLGALMFGGIGQGSMTSAAPDYEETIPICALGMLGYDQTTLGYKKATCTGPFSYSVSDRVVWQTLKAQGKNLDGRISFAAWCEGMNVDIREAR